MSFSLSVVLVDKVYNHFQHGVLFLSTAFRYHQGERHQGIVCYALGAVFIVKDAIAIEKPQEQRGSDTFVAIAEGVVLGDKVKQHGCLLFNRGIKVLASEGLVYLPDGAFERVVFLIAEKRAASELLMKLANHLHGIFVSGMKGCPGCGLFYRQLLIVVTVERIERISIVHYDIEQRTAVLGQPLLILDSTSQHLDQLAEFIELLTGYALIDGITLKQVLLQDFVCPNAELGTSF